ncbi:MAG: hypothetical protein AAFN30_14655 [Actinomycetota bacterium]
MTDASAVPPASKADIERLSAEWVGRSHVLHDELRRELQQRIEQLQHTMADAVRAEVEHGGRLQRSELRLLREELAVHGQALERLAAPVEREDETVAVRRLALLVLLAATVVTVLLIGAVTITVTG